MSQDFFNKLPFIDRFSDRTITTCYVKQYHRNHIRFIDAKANVTPVLPSTSKNWLQI
ncbi:MAG: hypothetical protein JJU46_11640 [Balneolaceae bacterium]|nr:hypothetical protein [Balneolaceae bacterium]MCH8548364.1 DUF3095 domain-containing protein [Balneolaceae bacterium]